MTTLVKATSKGQITLPASWRKLFETNRFRIEDKGNKLEITPFEIDEENDGRWDTIFDAKRDNNGKGVPIDEFIQALRNSLKV